MQDENDKAPEADVPETSPDTPDVADTSPETADVPETSPDTPEPADVPETAPEEPAVAPAPGPPADEQPVEDKARKARGKTATQQKKQADAKRHKEAVAAAPRPEPSKEDAEEQKRKAGLQGALAEEQAIIDDAEAAIAGAKERTKEILNELYPSLGASDRHVDAVRGYIASEKKLRANRALAPARLKKMLEAAGKAPIDAAFASQRGRGMKRPTRSAVTAAAAEGDAGADAAAAE